MINEIVHSFEKVNSSDTYLYFITRFLKPNIKKTDKVLDKFNYKLYQIDINDEIRKHLYLINKVQFYNILINSVEVHDYEVITDDTDQIFTYSIKDKEMSFADIVNNQLKNKPPKVQDLKELIINEDLWAYCMGFHIGDQDWIYSFRKILPSKVAIDERSGNKRNKFQKTIRTIFNSKSQKLELLDGETINLDRQIDCILYNDIFYILRKNQFEQIVGIEDEFKKEAQKVVKELKKTRLIYGIDILNEQLKTNPSLHRKLVKLLSIGNYHDLDMKAIKKMKKVCKTYGDKLKVKDDKLVIEDKYDIDLTLKMLADYYKLGEISGKAYGTFAGKQLKKIT